MKWNKMGWLWRSWCGRFTIEPSKIIPGRFDLRDRESKQGHVCKSPQAAQDVAQKISRRGTP